MTYLDHGATSFPKPQAVRDAVAETMAFCANPGRGSHAAARAGAEALFRCREAAGELFRIRPDHVVLTMNCTQGLNMAIRTLVSRGDRVVISGFEHNAVTRPLHGLGARVSVAGRWLFDPDDTLRAFTKALQNGAKCAVFTHVSNVFGYILPVEEMAQACRRRGVPFLIDAAQSAGAIPIDFERLGADYIAMPGHKGLLGPMGTGLLLCKKPPSPLLMGGTGSDSELQAMPPYLPDRGEAGTLNVPGFAGLEAGIRLVLDRGPEQIGKQEAALAAYTAENLAKLGYEVFCGPHQLGTISFRGKTDCQLLADRLASADIAVRAGLHCAPLAHKSAGTLQTGTVRISFGHDSTRSEAQKLLSVLETAEK